MKVWINIYIACISGCVILAVCFASLQGGVLKIFFLNIGQGDAVLILMPTGERVLIDGGPDDSLISELGDVMPFYDRKIEALVLTHPHADHVNGLVEVLRKFEVKQIILTGVSYGDPAYGTFLEVSNSQNVEMIFVGDDFDLQIGGVVFDLLYPFKSIEGKKFENVNNSSIAMRVLYGDFGIYLAGDLEVEWEEKLANSGLDLDVDVMKSSHHGSKTANSLELLSLMDADTVVISCGEGNSFKHPHIEAMRNFRSMDMEIFRTDIDGRVEIVTNGFDYSVTRSIEAPSD